MKFTSIQMAQMLHMTKYGFHLLAKKWGIPHKKQGNKFIFDTQSTQCTDFFASIEAAYYDPNLQAVYSIKDIAKLRGQSKDTIRAFLVEHDIKVYKSGRKWMVLLVDLQRFQQLIANK